MIDQMKDIFLNNKKIHVKVIGQFDSTCNLNDPICF